ncbi:hypothetical protein MCUN1_003514 [Malassezia cuniculi]|uniref:Uncharacterized protein n=1 Tax=Malassezia cuniculi TaxID=948313 RepID=A0AAF0J8B1_9BASI|nr:hypothetical protein MCUN1_003514 [Malassezia cuniculi]
MSVAGAADNSASQPGVRPLTDAERREHSRKHSHIHGRNLSAFFPRPGTAAEEEYDMARAAETHKRAPTVVLDTSPLKDGSLKPSPRNTRRAGYLQTGADTAEWEKRLPSSMRDGGSGAVSPDLVSRSSSSRVASTSPRSSSHSVPGASKRPSAMPLIAFAALHMSLGFVLWVYGQMRDSLALIGLGFLVVFDALGVLSLVSSYALEAAWLSSVDSARVSDSPPGALRRPYGVRRAETLMYFAELVYLVFAGMYMCKENMEHALLAANLPHAEDRDGIMFPKMLLLVTVLSCIVTSTGLRNHGALAAACGIDAHGKRSHMRSTSVWSTPRVGPLGEAFMNPFCALVLFFSTTLLLAAFLPAAPLASLDKVVAGLQGVAMLYVASFAVGALSRVLLQGAPDAPQLTQLHRALSIVEDHPLVKRVKNVQVWQLSPPSLAYHTAPTVGLLDGGSARRGARSAALIVTVHIEIAKSASAQECIETTRYIWQQCAPAVGAGAGALAGEPLRGSLVAGELTVEVVLMATNMATNTTTNMIMIMVTSMVTSMSTSIRVVMIMTKTTHSHPQTHTHVPNTLDTPAQNAQNAQNVLGVDLGADEIETHGTQSSVFVAPQQPLSRSSSYTLHAHDGAPQTYSTPSRMRQASSPLARTPSVTLSPPDSAPRSLTATPFITPGSEAALPMHIGVGSTPSSMATGSPVKRMPNRYPRLPMRSPTMRATVLPSPRRSPSMVSPATPPMGLTASQSASMINGSRGALATEHTAPSPTRSISMAGNVPDEVLMPPPTAPRRHTRTMSLGSAAYATPSKHMPVARSPRVAVRPLFTPPEPRVPPSHLPRSFSGLARASSQHAPQNQLSPTPMRAALSREGGAPEQQPDRQHDAFL